MVVTALFIMGRQLFQFPNILVFQTAGRDKQIQTVLFKARLVFPDVEAFSAVDAVPFLQYAPKHFPPSDSMFLNNVYEEKKKIKTCCGLHKKRHRDKD